ncbi:hypothetical protein SESBI_46385 [Sesbania bispinosa]|nr:hypothetical protein SESBI_46385 [Sesbania bispinosa]
MHAISAIASKNRRPEEYCHGWLTMEAYRATYEHFVKPTQSQQFWEKIDYAAPVPPPIKRSVGRPKKQRRRDVTEETPNSTRLKRSYADIICSRCGQSNHNIRKCINIGVPQKPKNWVDPAPVEPQAANTDPQAGPEEVILSQGVPSDDVPNSQPNMPPIVATSANSVQPSMPQSQAVGHTASRPPSRGRNFRNPPYKAPTTVQGGFRQKLNTVRPTNLTNSAPHAPGHNNTVATQTQLQPSNETMLAASLGTRSRFMQFIPTPPGPSTTGPRPRGPPPTGKPK